MGVIGQKAWNKVELDDSTLYRLYAVEKKSVVEIARITEIGATPIYRRLRELGISRSNSEAHNGLAIGKENPNWKGGRHFSKSGYVIAKSGVNKTNREHRIVAEKMLGRPLKKGEVVHHVNEKRWDNRPENLIVFPSHSEHMKHHAELRKQAALLAVMDS